MNSRAPTDLHNRMHTLVSSYDDDEAPDDEQELHPNLRTRNLNRNSSNNHSYSAQYEYKPAVSPHDEVDNANTDNDELSSISKKKKVKDRPWQKASEYNSIATTEEDMDIIGVSNVVSPNYRPTSKKNVNKCDSDDDDENNIFQDVTQEDIVYDSYSYDDALSKRWNNHQSSPDEAKAATVNAVGIAATQLADKLDQSNDDDDDLSYDQQSQQSRENDRFNSSHDFTTPRKPADHNRVRMEALNLLNLANNKDGGYLVRGESLKNVNNTKSTINETKKNRVKSALQGLSDGLGLDSNRRKYDKFTPDKMEFDDKDDVDLQDVPIEDMEYGQKKPSASTNGSWGSRYSIERHMMALHGGLSSRQVLKNMEQGQYDLHKQQQHQSMSMSATNMYKTSPHDHEDRWNVTKGARSGVPEGRSRIWNTWIAAIRESIEMVASKLSFPKTDEGHTTLGSHRQMDHSSSSTSPKGIFTGVAVTRFLHKLSPTSRSAAMKSFTDPDDVNFSAQDDYVYEQRLKRKKLFTALVTGILLFIVTIGVVAGLSNRSKSNIAESIYSDVGEDVKFFVTSDAPHNTADEIKLTRELANLHPRDGDFLIHLGDVGDASVNMCTLSVYQDAADLLKQSPIPVFVLPGDNDWNNCPDPRRAFEYWMEELNRFEDNFDKEENTNFPVVRRQLARTENFSFLHKGVLFIAFHLVDGKVQSESEWSLRIAEDVAWMDEEFNAHGVEDYRAVVILAHSAPTPKIGDFIWPLKNNLMKLKKPVLYIHANDGDGMLEYNPFPQDVPRLSVVRLEKGYKVAPTQILIETGPDPFNIHMNRK